MKVYNTPTNINQIRINCNHSNNNFFDKDTMKFFNSRITNSIKRTDTKDIYFITSEKFDCNSQREYTIRKYIHNTCNIETIGEFQQYDSLYKAKKAMNLLK